MYNERENDEKNSRQGEIRLLLTTIPTVLLHFVKLPDIVPKFSIRTPTNEFQGPGKLQVGVDIVCSKQNA